MAVNRLNESNRAGKRSRGLFVENLETIIDLRTFRQSQWVPHLLHLPSLPWRL